MVSGHFQSLKKAVQEINKGVTGGCGREMIFPLGNCLPTPDLWFSESFLFPMAYLSHMDFFCFLGFNI